METETNQDLRPDYAQKKIDYEVGAVQIAVRFEGDVPALFTALSAAQGEMGGAKKGSENPFFGSKYADIASVLKAAMPALTAHGLCLMQFPGWSTDHSWATMTTVLAHGSGGMATSEMACPMAKVDGPQALGSLITYMRRYSAQSILAVPAEDDDAEKVQTSHRRTTQAPKATPARKPPPKKAAPKVEVSEVEVLIPSANEHMTEAVELAEQAISLIEASETVVQLNKQDNLVIFDRVQKLDAEEYQRVLDAYRKQKQAIRGGK